MDEIKKIQNQSLWWFQYSVLVIIALLAVPYFRESRPYGPLDYAILPFHEAGHFIFAPLGRFICALGGTIVQLGIPLAFAVYFFFVRKDFFACGASLFWFFQQFINISVYMRDARFMLLPLFGGDEHDWNFLFGQMHLLNRSIPIADTFKMIGISGMIFSLIWLIVILFNSVRTKTDIENNNT